MLLAALAFALAHASLRVRIWSLVALLGAIAAPSFLALPSNWLEAAFLGCWISTAATAAAVHLPGGPRMVSGILLSLNAGFWARAVVALSGTPHDLLVALTIVILVVPAGWLVARGASIAVKVASSWLIAIAILAAVLPFLPVTPGYLPDHLE
ncbi:MAG: hypothetical protein JF608_08135 [Sphingomonadales bacterium]|nr:hypothetical protein [Sphingomonadales bacterium]